ncbi:unnamed protein product [Moneuplotes crassus]|uniref:Polyadenylate-binding protein n=1 Tax=Euplotes crassus TaxID=5936 RepID=A0AAD1U8G0_EUPCR|nr:unnamed protein product [Moneuplotes crassus]
MSQEDYLVHISELPTDVEKQDLEEFFKNNGIEGVSVSVLKPHYKLPIKWAKVQMGSSANYTKATTELRYPHVKHNIESRLLENITDGSLKGASETNAVVKGLNKEKVDSAVLEKFFSENVGPVKCCKVSKTIEQNDTDISCKSNGYGFVNFASKELLDKAIEELNGKELEGETISIERYNKDIKRDTKFNNLYVRGFGESFTEEDLKNLFSPYGELGSVKLMTDEEGKSKLFGFVCFVESEPALKAAEEMNNKDLGDGKTLYVAKFEKKANRWNALKKSLARANLYVRNFDKNVTEEDLMKFFGGDAVVRNVRIMTTDVNKEDGVIKESKQFGFVSFNNPNDASKIIQKYQNEDLEFNNKQLYVNYYEDKNARKKRLANSKKDNLMGILDQSFAGQGADGQNNMMEYFMQIFQQYFKNFQSQGFGGQYGGGYPDNYQHNYNRRGGPRHHNRGGYGGHSYNQYGGHGQNMYNRPPRQDIHNSYANASAGLPNTAPPMVGGNLPPTAPVSQAPPMPVQPPVTNASATKYVNDVVTLINGASFTSLSEDDKREKIGEEIYSYVLEKAGDESAPKITGMIIDLPFDDLISSIQTYGGIEDKIREGLELLQEDS